MNRTKSNSFAVVSLFIIVFDITGNVPVLFPLQQNRQLSRVVLENCCLNNDAKEIPTAMYTVKGKIGIFHITSL